jgi:hypothetical protein
MRQPTTAGRVCSAPPAVLSLRQTIGTVRRVLETPRFLMFKKLLISAFVILNLGTVLWTNRPKAVDRTWNRALETCPSPAVAGALRRAEALDETYADVAGEDAVWQMFCGLSRWDRWLVVKARYAGGREVVLPLPLQSDRTFWQQNVADFKEVKYHLGLFDDHVLRQGYSVYLARHYPAHDGAPLREIVWEAHYQDIRPMDQTRRLGSHLQPASYQFVLDTFTYP